MCQWPRGFVIVHALPRMDTPSVLYIRVELLPPPEAEGWNQEQQFTIVALPNAPYRKITRQGKANATREYTVMSAPVQANMAIVTAKCKPFRVPVMLHYEGGRLRLTAHTDREFKTPARWSYTLDYDVPLEAKVPRAPNSHWRVKRKGLALGTFVSVCLKPLAEIADEQWEFRGDKMLIEYAPPHPRDLPPIVVQLGIRKAVMASEKEDTCMTYYHGRSAALVDIFVHLVHDPFAIVREDEPDC